MKRFAPIVLLLMTSLPAVAADGPDRLSAAFDKLVEALADAKKAVVQHPAYALPEDRAAAMSYLSGIVIRTLEENVVQDPDYPLFRVLDFRIREGGDNPDQRYLFAPISGGARYRVWGNIGKHKSVDLQIYAGDPFLPGGGRVVSALSMEDLKRDAAGNFEVIVSTEKQAGNWMETAPDATELQVRQVFSDWKTETPGDIHLDRIEFEGALKPRPTADDMAAKLEAAAADLRQSARVWPNFVAKRYVEASPPNTLQAPVDASARGGGAGRWMGGGNFDLKDDEALVITTWPTAATYQGLQLMNLWFSSLEYANRQTSLNTDQAYLGKDGAYRFVVSAKDPGVQNWLDTTGLPRGVIVFRYDGLKDKVFPAERRPQAVKVKLAELTKHLPADTPAFSPEMRKDSIAARRRHVQVRFGN